MKKIIPWLVLLIGLIWVLALIPGLEFFADLWAQWVVSLAVLVIGILLVMNK